MSMQEADKAAAAVAKAPRVTLADIEGAIERRYFVSGHDAVASVLNGADIDAALDTLTICILVLKNGYTIIGKSAPACPENFDRNLGRKFAYDDAVRQIWPLMGFALRDQIMAAVERARQEMAFLGGVAAERKESP